jgi:hypothetical protein
VLRVQRSIHSEISLHVFSSSKAGVLQRSPFYGMRVDKVERVQKRFILYTLRSLGWTYIYDLPPYEHRCDLVSPA